MKRLLSVCLLVLLAACSAGSGSSVVVTPPPLPEPEEGETVYESGDGLVFFLPEELPEQSVGTYTVAVLDDEKGVLANPADTDDMLRMLGHDPDISAVDYLTIIAGEENKDKVVDAGNGRATYSFTNNGYLYQVAGIKGEDRYWTVNYACLETSEDAEELLQKWLEKTYLAPVQPSIEQQIETDHLRAVLPDCFELRDDVDNIRGYEYYQTYILFIDYTEDDLQELGVKNVKDAEEILKALQVRYDNEGEIVKTGKIPYFDSADGEVGTRTAVLPWEGGYTEIEIIYPVAGKELEAPILDRILSSIEGK